MLDTFVVQKLNRLIKIEQSKDYVYDLLRSAFDEDKQLHSQNFLSWGKSVKQLKTIFNLDTFKKERTYLLILNVRYFCSSKVARILLKNLSFPVSLFLICINWFISLPE
jgi:hypothetical protein